MKRVGKIFTRIVGIFSLVIAACYLANLIICENIPHIGNIIMFSIPAIIIPFECFVAISKKEFATGEDIKEFAIIGWILTSIIGILCIIGVFAILVIYWPSMSFFELVLQVIFIWFGIVFIYIPRLKKAKARFKK